MKSVVSPRKKIERRTLTRVLGRIEVTFKAGSLRGKGHIKNISKKGLFLRATALPPLGSEVQISFRDRAGNEVDARGTVCWTTEQLGAGEQAKPGFGIHIPQGNKALNEFFEQILFS